MYKYAIREVELNFPEILEMAISCKVNEYHEVVMELNDGTFAIYDLIEQGLRRIRIDRYNMTEEDCRREFGKRLAVVLRRKNVTQKELEERTGIPRSLISRYVTGKTSPSFYVVDKIAKALDCSMDDFRFY